MNLSALSTVQKVAACVLAGGIFLALSACVCGGGIWFAVNGFGGNAPETQAKLKPESKEKVPDPEPEKKPDLPLQVKKEKSEEAKQSKEKTPDTKPPEVKVAEKPTVKVDSVTLWNAYGDNALEADLKYKGKVVEVVGGVRDVSVAENDRYFIGFSVVEGGTVTTAQFNRMSAKEKRWHTEGYPSNVVCFIAAGHEKAFAGLKQFKAASITGRVVGRKSADVFRGYIVIIEDAQLVPDLPKE